MVSVGTVIAILNDSLVLVKSSADFTMGANLTVFERVPMPQLEEHGITFLDFPKGKIRISAKQAGDVYLAERFQLSEKVHPLLSVSSIGLSSLQRTETVWSADFDSKQNLKLGLDKVITTGDHVGKE